LLHIRYDPAKVTPEQMLHAIEKLDYEGKVVPDGDTASKT
jgi:hypothetical protein